MKYFRKDEKVILATGFLTSDPTLNDMFVKLRLKLTAYRDEVIFTEKKKTTTS